MRLNQVIAVEKGVKNRSNSEISELYKAIQKPALFDGFTKNYQPVSEDDERLPPQSQRVQYNANDVLRQVSSTMTELFDVTAMKDFANCGAKADVVVDGVTLLKDAPATYLLFLEKQLTDIHTFIDKLPTLDPAEEWSMDPNSGNFRSKTTATTRTKKVQKPLVLYPATDKHPAQTQLVTEDITAGTWEQVKSSGAIPEPRRKELLARVVKLQKAVKMAREEANEADVPAISVGDKIFGWLFGSGN